LTVRVTVALLNPVAAPLIVSLPALSGATLMLTRPLLFVVPLKVFLPDLIETLTPATATPNWFYTSSLNVRLLRAVSFEDDGTPENRMASPLVLPTVFPANLNEVFGLLLVIGSVPF
jgi:hypothetical protein